MEDRIREALDNLEKLVRDADDILERTKGKERNRAKKQRNALDAAANDLHRAWKAARS